MPFCTALVRAILPRSPSSLTGHTAKGPRRRHAGQGQGRLARKCQHAIFAAERAGRVHGRARIAHVCARGAGLRPDQAVWPAAASPQARRQHVEDPRHWRSQPAPRARHQHLVAAYFSLIASRSVLALSPACSYQPVWRSCSSPTLFRSRCGGAITTDNHFC
jgi:hypothetical protein